MALFDIREFVLVPFWRFFGITIPEMTQSDNNQVEATAELNLDD